MSDEKNESTSTSRLQRWWGEFCVPAGTAQHWRVGPMRLYAWRGEAEWRVVSAHGGDPLDSTCEVSSVEVAALDVADLSEQRYAVAYDDARLHLNARVADRPVVVQPATPLFVPPGQQATLYVSSVAWLELGAFAADGTTIRLFDIPARRPTDTWFGESTRDGELCYATKTLARTSSDLLMDLPHRIFTVVNITNSGEDMLPIEQLRVPAPNLNVYADDRHRLWTETVVFDRKEGASEATMQIGARPAEAGNALTISARREAPQSSAVVRAFSGLFG